MSSAAHSKAIWRDSALGAVLPTPTRRYWVDDGAGNHVLSDTGPEGFVFADVAGTGDFTLIAIGAFDPDTMARKDTVLVGADDILY